MFKKTNIVTLSLILFYIGAKAQTTIYFSSQTAYKNGIELLDKGKYAAAASQFSQVEKAYTTNTNRNPSNADLSSLKADAQYYNALCALALANDDAEDLMLNFINQHPESPKTKQAFFEIGRFYFEKENYTSALSWFTKVNSYNLGSKNHTEFKFKTAYSYFDGKNYEAAKPLFAAIKDNPNTYGQQATYYYAYIAYLNKDYSNALANFEKLKGTEIYQNSYPYYITAIYFLDKRYNDVINYAIPILNTSQQINQTEMLRIVGASYFANSDYVNAAKYYESFMAANKNATQNNQDAYQIGYTYFKLKKYNQAIPQLGKLINDKSEYSQYGIYTLGNAYFTAKNKQSARNAFQVASKLDFDKQLKQDALFNFAKLSYQLEFHNIALNAIEEYLKTYPNAKNSNEAQTLQAKILLSSKNYKSAIEVLEAMPDLNSDAQETYQKVTYFRALEFYNERAFENSISLFIRSNKYPSDAEIHANSTYWCAEAMYEVKKYSEAITYFTQFLAFPAAQKTDFYNYANYGLGYASFEDENYKEALKFFDKFLKGSQKDTKTTLDATLRLADAYFGAKNYTSALLNYNTIIAQKAPSNDYALFQRGVIEGLQNQPEVKIATLKSLLSQFPSSDYADDASFEIAYTYFLISSRDKAKVDFLALIVKYPSSAYLPRALLTIGLIYYDEQKDTQALNYFKQVITDYKASNEAQQALKLIERIYVDNGNAADFLAYANSTSIGNYTTAQEDDILFKAAYNRFTQSDWTGTVLAVNAYFDKFPKPIKDKQAKFIRAESFKNTQNFTAAITDYEYILSDWTSEYTERALLSIAKIYMNNKQYNEAIVHLKKLEIASENKANYNFAINNLMVAYAAILDANQTLKYVDLVKSNDKTAEDDRYKATLIAGKAYLLLKDTVTAQKQFDAVLKATKSLAAAEAKYHIAEIQYLKKAYKISQKTCFDLINNMPNYDYWVSKSFLLLADNYLALNDKVQAIATLKSIIDNYEGKDEILETAKQKLETINAN